MLTESLYKSMSAKLFELFFVDDNKYGRQQEDGSYRLIKEKLTLVTIDDMLVNHKSLLTYQEVHTLNFAFIKWVCIDLDISKKEIDEHDVNKENLHLVKSCAEDICGYLDKNNVPYLLEFSGRRGFHIWIIFEELQSKQLGFDLVNFILSQVTLKPTINVDRFPKTGTVSKKTKMVGFGIKLPLSQNKASNKLSYFLRKTLSFSDDQSAWLSEANDDFLKDQLEILNEFKPFSSNDLQHFLKGHNNRTLSVADLKTSYLKGSSLSLASDKASSLDEVLVSLKKCDHLNVLLSDYQLGLSGKNRAILVGLLGTLKTEKDLELGHNLLMELFSNIKGFRKDLTEEKLKLIKYYFPITCSQLARCSVCNCKEKKITSPVELIDGIVLTYHAHSIPNISKKIFLKIRQAICKYILINDEIPLFHLLKKVENVSESEISGRIEEIFQGKITPNPEVYEFKRNEEDKTRLLYSVNHVDNFISTYFLFLLNNLFYTAISDNSYGYKLAPGFYNANIFSNWFINWGAFSKKVGHILTNTEFAGYYVVKVDIKSFYDRIDLQRLKIKLYEESPVEIMEKLSSLDDDVRARYRNIIDYLIELSRNATGNREKGLPQGPAYARYLAELYLLGLDKLIENEIIKDKRREFYYRFVDDIFVFVENEQKASDVLKKIDKWILINNLELNPTKTEVSNVEDYVRAGKFKKFEDDAKYLINKANKNKALLSEDELQDALAKLGDLTNDVKFGLKDNLRFFYYQFTGDPRLNHIKDRLTQYLPFTNTGRGTLYMMFYSDLIVNEPDRFWAIAAQNAGLSGLSLGHYMNTILLNDATVSLHFDKLQLFIKDIETRDDLTDADRALVITLSRKFNFELSAQFLSSCSTTLILSAMETPEIRYTISDYPFIEEKLKEKDKKGFIKELYRIILTNPLDRVIVQRLSRYAITRFSEWHQSPEGNDFLDGDIAIEYYDCICFFSLFEDSTDHSALMVSWENLLSKSKTIKLTREISFDWLNRAVDHPKEDFSTKSLYTLLLANREGSALNKYKCEHGFLKKFQEILLILLFSKEIKGEDFQTKGKAYLDESSLFGKWLTDSNVRLYPIHDNICIRNLALNGIIVLENETYLFVKKINDGSLKLFDYLSIDKQSENEVELLKSSELEIYRPATNFISFLILVNGFIERAKAFMAEHKVHYPVFYKNPYTKEGFPLIPYYSIFPTKISPYGAIQPNNVHSFWENITFISQINNRDISLIQDLSNPFCFKIGAIDSRFFPQSEIIIESVEDKFLFLKEFISAIDDFKISTIYDFHYFWSKAVWSVLLQKKSKSDIVEFFSVHLANFPDPEMPLDILFTVNERSVIEKDNLFDFLNTIRSSLANFQSQVNVGDFSIVGLLDEEIAVLKDFIANEYSIGLEEFKRVEIKITTEFDTVAKERVPRMYVNGTLVSNKRVLVFVRIPIAFDAKKIESIAIDARSENIYVYENDEVVLIYIPEREISKVFGRIAERKKLLDQIIGTANDYNKLFPLDDNYKNARVNYDACDFNTTERKLRDHYTNTPEIKNRVVSWLSLFNDQSLAGSKFDEFLTKESIRISKVHRALIELVNVHYSVSAEALETFRTTIKNYDNEAASILFPLKHPDRDLNGLSRMLRRCGFKDRELDFERYARELFTKVCDKKTLVILADTTISGSQAETSLHHYLAEYKDEAHFNSAQATLTGKERYFNFSNYEEAKMFRNNLEKMETIVFVSPIITDAFRDRMNNLPIFKNKTLQWSYTEELKEKAYNWEKARLDADNERILVELIKDVDLLNKIFEIPDLDFYKNSIKKIEDLNILLRIGSLSSKHIRLFSLVPRNGFLSLFDYIKNWSK